MLRLPDYLKRGIIDTEKTKFVRSILKENCLNTVCDEARCPNKAECYAKDTAAFLIMGRVCTRNCRFCSIDGGIAEKLDEEEPKHIAQAVKSLKLNYAVITSVTRDDLQDGGAGHFAKVIYEIRNKTPHVKIEVLTPDFLGKSESIDTVIKASPDVCNHNIETVKRLYQKVRPEADYRRSLNVLAQVKTKAPHILTKSGLMIGLGETFEELEETLIDLKNSFCSIVTIGQYIRPSKEHAEVVKYYTKEEFDKIEKLAKRCGISHAAAGGLIRSSYRASETYYDKINES